MNRYALPLLISITIAQLAGVIGGIFTASSVTNWYVEILKPEWTPPSWLFGPAWITLYTLMGIAAFLVWQKRRTFKKSARTNATKALVLYGVHLILNSLWSVLFFGLKNPGAAFAEILVLLSAIIATTMAFWKIDKRAGWLLVPYLAWASFATALNFSIWQLN